MTSGPKTGEEGTSNMGKSVPAGRIEKGGYQPTKDGPTTPPQPKPGWTPPAGAINPITGKPFK